MKGRGGAFCNRDAASFSIVLYDFVFVGSCRHVWSFSTKELRPGP